MAHNDPVVCVVAILKAKFIKMMDIQKHIDDSTVEAEKALELYRKMVETNQFSRMELFMNCYLAFSNHAAKLTLLLKSDTESNNGNLP